MCCAVMGLKIIIVMPESMSLERRKLIQGYGAELVLTPKEEGMQGAVNKAEELKKLGLSNAEISSYKKITLYDEILINPDLNKIK